MYENVKEIRTKKHRSEVQKERKGYVKLKNAIQGDGCGQRKERDKRK